MQQQPSQTNLGALLSQLISQIETLMSAHLRLARQEPAADGKKLVTQSVGIVLGGVLAFLGIIFLGVALIFGIAVWVDTWLAALIVALVFLAAGGVLAYLGTRRITKIDPVGRTREETQETIAWLTRKQ